MTDFTTRLNQAMELRNIKQIDFVKAAQDRWSQAGAQPHQSICERQNKTAPRY